MAVCGLWLSGRRLVGIVVDDRGRAVSTALTAATDDERWEMLRHLDDVHGLDSQLVVPDLLVRSDVICHFALERRQVTWAAPQSLIEAIRRTASVNGPAATAAMISSGMTSLLPPNPPPTSGLITRICDIGISRTIESLCCR